MSNFRIQKEWTEAEIATLAQLWSEGHSTAEIGRRMGGLSKNAIIGRAHRSGLPKRASPIYSRVRAGAFWSTERDAAIRKFCTQSMSYTEMAGHLGMSRSSVANRVNELGLVAKKAQKPPAPAKIALTRPPPVARPVIVVVNGPVPTVMAVQVSRQAPVARQYTGRVTECTFPTTDCRPWLFCENPTLPGRSMCSHHHAISYVASAPREFA